MGLVQPLATIRPYIYKMYVIIHLTILTNTCCGSVPRQKVDNWQVLGGLQTPQTTIRPSQSCKSHVCLPNNNPLYAASPFSPVSRLSRLKNCKSFMQRLFVTNRKALCRRRLKCIKSPRSKVIATYGERNYYKSLPGWAPKQILT